MIKLPSVENFTQTFIFLAGGLTFRQGLWY